MDILSLLNLAALNSGACYGDKHWLCSPNAPVLTSINPATEQPLAQVTCATVQDYSAIMAAAAKQFSSWRSVPAPKRGELIWHIGQEIRRKKAALGRLIALEVGKSLPEGLGEVQEIIDMADLAVGQSRMLYGYTMHSERPQHRMYEQWHPLGIVAIISAFNFPMAVWSWNAFLAAIAGNTVIWKPSSKTPLCAIALQHICNKVMAEHGYSAVFSLLISEDKAVKDLLINDKRVPLISFTGSTTTGKKINAAVAQRLGRCLLEMSGNNAVIIDESANLDLAVPALVFGAIGTSGQRCTTTRRVLIHEHLYDRLTDKLVNAYQQIQARIGDPLTTGTLMGPLIDQTAVATYCQTIAKIRQAGGEILIGGNALPGPGYFVEPTLARVENHWPIVQQETFAPILYLLKFKAFSEAIQLQNSVAQGLSSALFTRDLQHTEQFLSSSGSDCGIANINLGTSGAEIGGAFGGEKDTGGGREAGSDAWQAYMRRQTTTINWGNNLPLAQGIRFE